MSHSIDKKSYSKDDILLEEFESYIRGVEESGYPLWMIDWYSMPNTNPQKSKAHAHRQTKSRSKTESQGLPF